MMIKDPVLKKLNEQINLEFFSGNIYLQMSAWCADQGLEGCAAFLRDHYHEEQMHMFKLWDYVEEMGEIPVLGSIESPATEYSSLPELMQVAFDHEEVVTASIGELVDLTLKESDHATHNFLQWYVDEQVEEEALFRTILDKIKVIGTDGQGLYFIDQEVAKILAAEKAAEATEA
jgi:ferritin